jgi:hypothetical protein
MYPAAMTTAQFHRVFSPDIRTRARICRTAECRDSRQQLFPALASEMRIVYMMAFLWRNLTAAGAVGVNWFSEVAHRAPHANGAWMCAQVLFVVVSILTRDAGCYVLQ